MKILILVLALFGISEKAYCGTDYEIPPIEPSHVGETIIFGGLMFQASISEKSYSISISHTERDLFYIHFTERPDNTTPFTRLAIISEFKNLDIKLMELIKILRSNSPPSVDRRE